MRPFVLPAMSYTTQLREKQNISETDEQSTPALTRMAPYIHPLFTACGSNSLWRAQRP
jgi:hypothetical protein